LTIGCRVRKEANMTDIQDPKVETPDENQGSQKHEPVQADSKNEYDGSTPPRVSPKLIGTLAGCNSGMNRVAKRTSYLTQKYEELKKENESATNLVRKDEILKEKEKIAKEAPKLKEAREALEALLPILEEKNKEKLENIKFDTLDF
jgi:hypothetical protein